MLPRDDECLELVQRGAMRHPLDRALLLATVAEPAVAWADRALGARDARLIDLRCEWFGRWFDALVDCECCGKALSLRVDLAAMLRCARRDETPVACDGVRFRLPTSRDLAFVAHEANAQAAVTALFRRLAVDGGIDGWSEDRVAAIDTALEAADPLAHIALDVACEHCGERFAAPLDIGAALWDELAAHAGRIVDDVHMLAQAYGWNEREILAMSPARRALYRERIGP